MSAWRHVRRRPRNLLTSPFHLPFPSLRSPTLHPPPCSHLPTFFVQNTPSRCLNIFAYRAFSSPSQFGESSSDHGLHGRTAPPPPSRTSLAPPSSTPTLTRDALRRRLRAERFERAVFELKRRTKLDQPHWAVHQLYSMAKHQMRPPASIMDLVLYRFLDHLDIAGPDSTGLLLQACGKLGYRLRPDIRDHILDHATRPGVIKLFDARHVNQHIQALRFQVEPDMGTEEEVHLISAATLERGKKHEQNGRITTTSSNFTSTSPPPPPPPPPSPPPPSSSSSLSSSDQLTSIFDYATTVDIPTSVPSRILDALLQRALELDLEPRHIGPIITSLASLAAAGNHVHGSTILHLTDAFINQAEEAARDVQREDTSIGTIDTLTATLVSLYPEPTPTSTPWYPNPKPAPTLTLTLPAHTHTHTHTHTPEPPLILGAALPGVPPARLGQLLTGLDRLGAGQYLDHSRREALLRLARLALRAPLAPPVGRGGFDKMRGTERQHAPPTDDPPSSFTSTNTTTATTTATTTTMPQSMPSPSTDHDQGATSHPTDPIAPLLSPVDFSLIALAVGGLGLPATPSDVSLVADRAMAFLVDHRLKEHRVAMVLRGLALLVRPEERTSSSSSLSLSPASFSSSLSSVYPLHPSTFTSTSTSTTASASISTLSSLPPSVCEVISAMESELQRRGGADMNALWAVYALDAFRRLGRTPTASTVEALLRRLRDAIVDYYHGGHLVPDLHRIRAREIAQVVHAWGTFFSGEHSSPPHENHHPPPHPHRHDHHHNNQRHAHTADEVDAENTTAARTVTNTMSNEGKIWDALTLRLHHVLRIYGLEPGDEERLRVAFASVGLESRLLDVLAGKGDPVGDGRGWVFGGKEDQHRSGGLSRGRRKSGVATSPAYEQGRRRSQKGRGRDEVGEGERGRKGKVPPRSGSRASSDGSLPAPPFESG